MRGIMLEHFNEYSGNDETVLCTKSFLARHSSDRREAAVRELLDVQRSEKSLAYEGHQVRVGHVLNAYQHTRGLREGERAACKEFLLG